MEELTSDTELTADIGVDAPITIRSVSEYWVTNMSHMDTDLMGTTGLDTTLEERECWNLGLLDSWIQSIRNS